MEKRFEEVMYPITIREVMEAGQCVSGQRRMFSELTGRPQSDFKDFVKNGIPVEASMKINEPLTLSILRKREVARVKQKG